MTVLRRSECGGPSAAEVLQTLRTPEPQPSTMDRPVKRPRLDLSSQAKDASRHREWRELGNVMEHNDSSEVSDATQHMDWDEVGHLMEHSDVSSAGCDLTQRRDWEEVGHPMEHSDVSSEVRNVIQSGDWRKVGHLMERGQLSEEQRSQVVETAGQGAEEEELAAFILPVLTEGELHRVLDMLFTRCLWPAVGKLLRQNISSTLNTQILSKALRLDKSRVFTTHVVPNCKFSQLDEFVTHLVATGQWQFVTNLLDIVSDENATWRVGDTQVDSRVLGLVARGLWLSVSDVLRSGVSDALRRWVIGVACQRAEDWDIMYILPFCTGDQRDVVLEKLVTRGLWMSVDKLLGDGVSPTQHRWALHEACQKADDAEFVLFIAPHCADGQLDDVLTTLVTRGLWKSVSRVLDRGVSPTQHSWAVQEYCQQVEDEHAMQWVFPHCTGDVLGIVLEKLVARGWWMSVDKLLGRGVSPTQHRWALHEACQKADDAEFVLFIAPHCADDQLDDVLTTLVTRRLWKSVSRVLQRIVSPTKRSLAVHEACQKAGDAEFELFIAPHCSDDQLDDVLTTLVTRRLWNSVSRVLERGVSPTQHSWAVQEYCQHAEDEHAMQWVFPHCAGDVLGIVLEKLVARGWWMSVDTLLGRGVSPTQHRWALHEACQKADDAEFVLFIAPHCADDQLDDVLTTLVTRRLWNSVSRVLERGVSPTQHSWAVHEACQHVGDEDVLECILPHCDEDQLDDVLTTLVTRRLWKSVNQVLECDVSPEKHSWAVQEACQHSDDEDALQHLLDKHVYDEDEDILTILASRGLWEYVARMLHMDVNATKAIHDGISVLHSLIRLEDWDLVEPLLGYVEEFHQHAFCAEEGHGDRRTPIEILIDARQTEIIRHIASKCLDLSRGVNSERETTLHVACLTGSPSMLQDLVGKRVDPRAVTVSGHSALSYAVMCSAIPQQTVAECIRLGFSTHQSHLANFGEAPGVIMAQDTMGTGTPGVIMAQDTMGTETPGVIMAQDTMGTETPGVIMAQDTMGTGTPGANMAQDTMEGETPGANMAQDTMGIDTPGANMAQDTMGREDTTGREENHMEDKSLLPDNETQRLEENHSNVASSSENDANNMNTNSSDCDDTRSINGGDGHNGENATNSMNRISSDHDDVSSVVSGFDDTRDIDSDDTHSMTSDSRDSMMSSPTLLAVMRGLLPVTQMLYESGACSYRELFRLQPCLRDLLHADPAEAEELKAEFCKTVIRVYENDPDGEFDYMDVDILEVDPERVQECARYLQEVSLHPRSLKSTCRLVISHCLKLHDKREEDVGQLPLAPPMRRDVMFSDLTHPDFGS